MGARSPPLLTISFRTSKVSDRSAPPAMIQRPMTLHEFYFRLFSYRLDVTFAQQRYALEVQALEQLKITYDGQVPQVVWEKQRRRVKRAQMQVALRRSMLTVFLQDLRN